MTYLGKETTFRWLGHATFVIGTPSGCSVLIDPWFENPSFPVCHLCSDRCSTSQQPHHQQQLQSNAMRDRSLGVHEAAFYPSKIDARILLPGGHLGEIPGDGDDGDHQDNSE